ncbi:unannotated protein [freshwater metagenome]|uniref:Unannotated protein n=1 Tax=freshwater metagenome TaxID=449393 RepID=A0A6J6N1R8_9ZZZZ
MSATDDVQNHDRITNANGNCDRGGKTISNSDQPDTDCRHDDGDPHDDSIDVDRRDLVMTTDFNR